MQKIVTGMMILTLVVVLSGCAEMSQTERSTLTGGAVGTAGGALIGAIAGNAGLGAAIGAGVGVAGGYLLRQAQRNRAEGLPARLSAGPTESLVRSAQERSAHREQAGGRHANEAQSMAEGMLLAARGVGDAAGAGPGASGLRVLGGAPTQAPGAAAQVVTHRLAQGTSTEEL